MHQYGNEFFVKYQFNILSKGFLIVNSNSKTAAKVQLIFLLSKYLGRKCKKML